MSFGVECMVICAEAALLSWKLRGSLKFIFWLVPYLVDEPIFAILEKGMDSIELLLFMRNCVCYCN